MKIRMCGLVLLVCTWILFSVNNFSQSLDNGKLELKTILEKMRTETGLNFIYGDNIVGHIKADSNNTENFNEENLKKMLNDCNLAYKFFGNKDVVIFKKSIKKRKNSGTVVIKNILENDSGNIIEPKIISGVLPVYPPEAVSGNIEGTVRIKLYVTTKGDVFKIIVQKSSGSALLDSAAVNYASKLKYIPAKVNGKYCNIWLYKDFKYYIVNKHNSK